MRGSVLVALAVLLLQAVLASAATPVSPPSGSAFTTTDTATFVADPGSDERDVWFLFSKGPAFDPEEWFAAPGDDGGHTTQMNLGWLAMKFDYLGTFSWVACPGSDSGPGVFLAECSQSLNFAVSYRMSTLSRSEARRAARKVMRTRVGSYWRGGYNRRVSCRPVTRTRQRCRVSLAVGDVSVSGRVTVYNRRVRTYDLPYFRARIRAIDEYCLLVRKEPRSECVRVKRAHGSVWR